MSTPIPQDTELEGLDIYAPRRVRKQPTPENQVSDPQTLPLAPECDQPQAEQNEQASTARSESASAAETQIEDAIRAAIELARSLGGPEPPVPAASLPSAANLRLPPDQAPLPPSQAPLLHGDFTKSGPRRRSGLDPEIVPGPPNRPRRRIVAPMLVAFTVLCAAIIAYGFAITPGFQLDGRWSKRTSDSVPVAAPAFNEPASVSRPLARLVIENQKAFANEPLLLGVSVDSATGNESLMLAGLALGTRLSAGVPVSEASWQLSSRELNGVYVYAPKDFVGTMNAAIELLSPNKRLMESRAMQLQWIAKPNPSEPGNRIGSETAGAAATHAIDPEAARLMERGRDLMRSGDIASARLLFRRLADAGVADAALALAVTYDPHYLAEHGLIGIVGDEAKARGWYQRASDLGSTEAGRILARTGTK